MAGYQGIRTFDLIAVYNCIFLSQCCLWSHNIKQVVSFISISHQISRSYLPVSSEVRRMIISQSTGTKNSNILRQPFSIYKSYLSEYHFFVD